MPDELMTLNDGAALLGIGRGTLEWLIREGRLDVVHAPPAPGKKRPKPYLRKEQVTALTGDRWRIRAKPGTAEPSRRTKKSSV
jgi:hypothetical protein